MAAVLTSTRETVVHHKKNKTMPADVPNASHLEHGPHSDVSDLPASKGKDGVLCTKNTTLHPRVNKVIAPLNTIDAKDHSMGTGDPLKLNAPKPPSKGGLRTVARLLGIELKPKTHHLARGTDLLMRECLS